MNTPSKPKPNWFDDAFAPWLKLVAAIAVGTFLGLMLFSEFWKAEIRREMHDVQSSPYTTTTTPAWSP